MVSQKLNLLFLSQHYNHSHVIISIHENSSIHMSCQTELYNHFPSNAYLVYDLRYLSIVLSD